MLIVGLNTVYHESSVALIRDGELIAAIEEERLNRVKHAKLATVEGPILLPYAALDAALSLAGATIDDVDRIALTFEPEVRFQDNVAHAHPYATPTGEYGSSEGERRLLAMCRLIPDVLSARYGRDLTARCEVVPHHACHAASAYFPSPFAEAAVLSIDGIGEFESTTRWHGRDGVLRQTGEVRYPHSLGFLWERITAYLGFAPGHDECKVMGLAAHGDPARFASAFARFAELDRDGGFTLSDDVLRFRNPSFAPLEALLGPRRLPHEPLDPDGEEARFADVAATLQAFTEAAVLAQARRVREETGARHLCMAGGVALNCVANARIVEAGIFEDVWVQPAANDAGTAVGAASLVWAEASGGAPLHAPDPVRLGPSFDDDQVVEALHDLRLPVRRVGPRDVARRIADGEVVGWFQGRMEFGPRALGSRSILADPRTLTSRRRVNAKIKRRELFRPLCPSVLADRVPDWFVVDRVPAASAYMLMAFPVREEVADRVPAVKHVDGTARLQALTRDADPRFHALITAFEEITGIPMVLNTSFNSQEPIVCTPQDALRTFLRTDLDALVLGDHLVTRADVAGEADGDVELAS